MEKIVICFVICIIVSYAIIRYCLWQIQKKADAMDDANADRFYEYRSLMIGFTPTCCNSMNVKGEMERNDRELTKHLIEGYEIWEKEWYENEHACFWVFILRKHL